jgi:DNA modification methylase
MFLRGSVMSYELIYKKVGDLLPYINNARTHSEEQINQIAASIREFGFTNPLLIDGVGTIIAGHGRLHGAKKSGLEEVPCIVLDHLTKAQQKALIIADNQLALNAGWDMDLLSVEMKDLDAEGFDLSLMGFNDDMLANMLKEETEGLTDEDAVPEVPDDPVTVLGDVWVLGKHRLMCGDSTSIDAVEKLMGGQKANMAFTSPPYNAGKSELLSGNTHSGDNKYGDYNDDKSDSEYLDLLVGFTNAWINACEFLAVNLQQLAGNKTSFVDYMGAYKDNLIDVCIWDKGHATPAMVKNVLNSRFEYILLLTSKKKPSRAIPGANFRGTISNVYSGPPNRNNEFSKVHAATFPVAFAEWAVESFTSLNAIVADPFGGTGTTMIAAEKHNRVCMMMELDPKYCDVIIQRWCDFTGEDAILERTGETFSVLKKGSGKNAA